MGEAAESIYSFAVTPPQKPPAQQGSLCQVWGTVSDIYLVLNRYLLHLYRILKKWGCYRGEHRGKSFILIKWWDTWKTVTPTGEIHMERDHKHLNVPQGFWLLNSSEQTPLVYLGSISALLEILVCVVTFVFKKIVQWALFLFRFVTGIC